MPRPAGSEMKYLPGLDGMRAIAVAALGSIIYSYFLWREEHDAARAAATRTEAGR